MTFKLSVAKNFFNSQKDKKEVENLKKLGFTFLNIDNSWDSDNLQVNFNKERLTIEINSLEELIELSKTFGDILINDSYLEIYNDYREC